MDTEEIVFPLIKQIKGGFKVQTSSGASIPGTFLNYMAAERALEKHLARKREVKNKWRKAE